MDFLNKFSPVAAILVLAGIAAGTLARPNAADAEPYHARIRALATQMPTRIGDWTSQETQIPYSAVELLKPNVLISRIFTNVSTGATAGFVLVQSKDARSMIGHYPPNCYPHSGWTLDYKRKKTWVVNGITVKGMAYGISMERSGILYHRVVDDVMFLPDGRFVRTMDQVIREASDYTRHFFGAAQIQLLTSAQLTESQRDDLFKMFLKANLPLIQAIRSGVKNSD